MQFDEKSAIISVVISCHPKHSQNYILLENKMVLMLFLSIKVIMESALELLNRFDKKRGWKMSQRSLPRLAFTTANDNLFPPSCVRTINHSR